MITFDWIGTLCNRSTNYNIKLVSIMAKEIAKSLLDIEAVTLSPNDLYTWSSGIKNFMITFDWIGTLCNRSTNYNMRRTKLSCFFRCRNS
jgi:hypothetical protein